MYQIVEKVGEFFGISVGDVLVCFIGFIGIGDEIFCVCVFVGMEQVIVEFSVDGGEVVVYVIMIMDMVVKMVVVS